MIATGPPFRPARHLGGHDMTTTTSRLLVLSVCAITTAFAVHPAAAQAEKKMHVDMTSAQEVPPNGSKGTGTADFTYNTATKEITWSITTSALSANAVAAHIHGPAAPGSNAGVVVNLAPNGMTNPLKGSATLTAAQAADLLAGKDYVNVHTAANPGGEIRGQISPP
jgi:hypothetical protein